MLSDAFAAALAKRGKAETKTGDPEFKTVEREKPRSFGIGSCSSQEIRLRRNHDRQRLRLQEPQVSGRDEEWF
jgi:hypothetical protein